MKNYFVFAVVLLFFLRSNPLTAQVTWSISGGLNIASLDPQLSTANAPVQGGINFSYSKALSGYYGLIASRITISRTLLVQIAAHYAQKGYETYRYLFVPIGGGGTGITKTFTRLQVAGLGADLIYVLPLGNGKISIGAGAFADYPVSGKIKSVDTTTNVYGPGTFTTFSKISSKKLVPDVNGSLRYEFDFGILAEIGYEYLFHAQPAVNLSIYSFGIGYRLPFKRRH